MHKQLEMTLTMRADIPESNYGANVSVKIPMPRAAVAVTTELVGGGANSGGSAGARGVGPAGAGGTAATGQVGGWVRGKGGLFFVVVVPWWLGGFFSPLTGRWWWHVVVWSTLQSAMK